MMAGSLGWGLVASSSLLIGALIALRFSPGSRNVGLIMAFGAGVLISAVAFDLVEEASGVTDVRMVLVAGLLTGCFAFSTGNWLIDRAGGHDRKDVTGAQQDGSPLAIVLGTVLDGIPESMVIGLALYQGGSIGVAYVIAVFISNLPEAISSTAGLVESGWRRSRIIGMWTIIAVTSASASVVGYRVFQDASPGVIAFVLTFAAGAILTMLADTMMPEAYEHGGKAVGVMATTGFALAYTIHLLD